MSKKIDKRIESIYNECENWAYRVKGKYIISFFELAGLLNNMWRARDFLDMNKLLKNVEAEHQKTNGDFCIAFYNLHVYRRPLKDAVRKIKGAKIVKFGYADWFEIPLREQRKGGKG